jgi:hypothetical protein
MIDLYSSFLLLKYFRNFEIRRGWNIFFDTDVRELLGVFQQYL